LVEAEQHVEFGKLQSSNRAELGKVKFLVKQQLQKEVEKEARVLALALKQKKLEKTQSLNKKLGVIMKSAAKMGSTSVDSPEKKADVGRAPWEDESSDVSDESDEEKGGEEEPGEEGKQGGEVSVEAGDLDWFDELGNDEESDDSDEESDAEELAWGGTGTEHEWVASQLVAAAATTRNTKRVSDRPSTSDSGTVVSQDSDYTMGSSAVPNGRICTPPTSHHDTSRQGHRR